LSRALALGATLLACAAAAHGAAAASPCSTSGLRIDVADQRLPAAVARKRDAIVGAALACDYARLARLAAPLRSFSYSFGESGRPAAYWRAAEQRGEPVLRRLVQLLSIPFVRNEAGFYAWPSAYTEHPTPRDWARLEGIYPARRLAAMRREGVYYGYRIGITPKGGWRFFVAGD
jgi:hypothetical protein